MQAARRRRGLRAAAQRRDCPRHALRARRRRERSARRLSALVRARGISLQPETGRHPEGELGRRAGGANGQVQLLHVRRQGGSAVQRRASAAHSTTPCGAPARASWSPPPAHQRGALPRRSFSKSFVSAAPNDSRKGVRARRAAPHRAALGGAAQLRSVRRADARARYEQIRPAPLSHHGPLRRSPARRIVQAVRARGARRVARLARSRLRRCVYAGRDARPRLRELHARTRRSTPHDATATTSPTSSPTSGRSSIPPLVFATAVAHAGTARRRVVLRSACKSIRSSAPIPPPCGAASSGASCAAPRFVTRRDDVALDRASHRAWLRTRGSATRRISRVRRGRGIRAYVFGVRVPERDAYVFDEFGFSDDDAAAIFPALLRAAAGDLRRVVGWLPPGGARQNLPRGTTRRRNGRDADDGSVKRQRRASDRDALRQLKRRLHVGDGSCLNNFRHSSHRLANVRADHLPKLEVL